MRTIDWMLGGDSVRPKSRYALEWAALSPNLKILIEHKFLFLKFKILLKVRFSSLVVQF